MTRAVFLGSPEAAIPALEKSAATLDLVKVITQPDRARARSGRLSATPVKARALEMGIPVAEPDTHQELHREIRDAGDLDVGVVVAYGRIIKPEVLDAPTHGLLNIHFSLLPRWRGAAPVNRAIMAGDPMSGVTIIKIDEGLDTGPVVNAQAVDIHRAENATELTARLARLGADLLARSLPPYLEGEMVPVPQTGDGATYAAKLERSDRPIDLDSEPAAVINHVRGLAENPGATLDIDGTTHKILESTSSTEVIPKGEWRAVDGVPLVGLDGGSVEILRLQAPGKNVVTGADWVRGRHTEAGETA